MALRGRSCALQGRVLLVNSLVLSQLWYKTRLSSPSRNQLTAFKTLAWEAVWQGKLGLKPFMPDVGLRPRRFGGVGLIDAALQIPALQATWIARALTLRPRPPWGQHLTTSCRPSRKAQQPWPQASKTPISVLSPPAGNLLSRLGGAFPPSGLLTWQTGPRRKSWAWFFPDHKAHNSPTASALSMWSLVPLPLMLLLSFHRRGLLDAG